MKLTEKEKDILESVLYYAKENYYVLWHAGEMKTKRYEEYALAIESIKKKIWKTDYEADDEKKVFDDLATHNERFSNYGEDD